MKHYYKKFSLFACLLFVLGFCTTSITAQTTITTNHTNNNGFAIVTFNFTNNNAGGVVITDIGSVCTNTGSTDVAAYYKTSAINGAPGAINAGNGWNQFGTATIAGVGTTGNVPQPFMTGLTLIVPAGATYGICVEAKDATGVGNLAYSTVNPGTYTFTGGACTLTTGTNIGFAGDVVPNAPTFTPRGFIGSVTFIGAAACTGVPNPGNTVSSVASACPTIPFTLSLENPTAGTGVTYQWKSSPDGITYTNVPVGGTNSTYTTTLNASTYYKCDVTCSGNTTTSIPKQVLLTPPSGCYCIPPNSLCSDNDVILEVKIGTLDNVSDCSGPTGYSDYTIANPPLTIPDVIVGAPNSMSVTVPTVYTEYVAVWIDYNHNGAFEANEYTLLGPDTGPGGGTITNNINVPGTALLGNTRMRVRDMYFAALTPGQACTGYVFGETEDYTVNLIPCIQGVINTPPSDATTTCGGNASFYVDASGSILAYQWEYRVNSSSPWLNVPNTPPYSGVNSPTLTLSNVSSALDGYQYRAIVSGACTAIISSGFGTLTVNPFVPNVVPASPVTLCNGQIQQFSTAPATTVFSVSSGPISIAVPDNTANGVSATLAVAGIPAGAFITSMTVTLNMTHTYCGDMIFNLKGPTGQILALDKYLTGSANQAGNYPNIGFTNTVISSIGVNPLSSAASQPITGTFRADALLAIPFAIQNPTGFASNVTTWPPLYTPGGPNGTWTLAMADGGPADLGVLTSWTITINYQSGPPATAIWSPLTGLFTDPAATVPYTGTAVSTIYAAPTVTTNYTLLVTTPTCTSTTNVLVNVNNPVGGVSTVANETTCDNSNTSFSVSADSGNTINYSWEESTDGGITWNTVSNGGVFSGATTSTLTITGATLSMSGNLYHAILTVPTCNALTSNDATLTVNPNPVVSISAAPYTKLFPGLTTTISSSVSPNPAATYQWFRDGLAIPGATGSTTSVDVDGLGDYTLSVTDINGCSSLSNTVTISDSANDIMFIYPNPNTGQFQIRYYSLPGNTLVRSVVIYDSKGARVYYKTYGINVPYGRIDVDMSNYSRGVYMVELGDLNGARIKTGRVIIF